MAINKVIKKGVVELDLTSDTVTPETLTQGITAHNAAGESIIGTASSGVDTTDATATAADMLSGKTAYVDGEKITGNIPSKSSSDLTSSGATVTVPAGHYASEATKTIAYGSAKTPATTITKNPTISVNSSGLITASVSGTQSVTPTVTSGYVSSGTAGTITVSGSATKQLTVQAAQTITPGTSNKTIASGRYLTGTQTIKGDANLKAENIKSGVSIFGITGTHSGGENLEAIISEQETLIEELSTALDGKASGGSGSSDIETCSVSISFNFGSPGSILIAGTQLVDNMIQPFVFNSYNGGDSFSSPYTITNIVKGSPLTIVGKGSYMLGNVTCNGCELLCRAIVMETVMVKITTSDASVVISNDY